MQDEKRITALFTINHPDFLGCEHFGEWSKRDNNRYIETNFCVAASSSIAIPRHTFLLRYGVAVTLRSGYERRPDLVIYIKDIPAIAIELKRSSVEVAYSARQLITT